MNRKAQKERLETRRQKMLRLRDEKGWSLEKIGEMESPPISRERVRQIIGNTGRDFRRQWTERLKAGGDFAIKHITSLQFAPGVKRVWREDWGQHRHEARGGPVQMGQQFEERASQILKRVGVRHKLMPFKRAYNILTDNGTKIDVTVSHADISKIESQNCVSPTYAVTANGGRGFDFLFVFLPDGDFEGEYTYYVIPATELRGLSQNTKIRIPHPQTGPKGSKWHDFHKRIDLIK